ncbi:glycosyltransferase family 4 protein [Rossellomorea marisflavi]|uniref:glycosyltransferase family 4 protein n=1 Tax=Rossellomorea marisflavi TaxID=189381 RepID=UPI00279E0BC4|nr:glycosyltransferase family 4 protein [Rossellomorea marisflavi]UTE73406.1 glycosyltransferase family 4 protein [Rossellomorea marisflavi]
MKKILIVSTVSKQFYLFEEGNIEVLNSMGYEVHAAANFSDVNERLNDLKIIQHHFDIERSPFSLKNIKAYKQLKKIMRIEKFDAVHCHSPMGGVIARIASRSEGITNILYTAHGYHFYKGSPIINWLLYYPIERFLAQLTRVLITINKEDYENSKKFKAEKIFHVPGIGVNVQKFKKVKNRRGEIRKQLGIKEDTIVILSIGELIKRKNYETALKSIAKVSASNVEYLICGTGQLEKSLKNLSLNLDVSGKVRFLGFRNDIAEICAAADLFLFPSHQEGLPVSVMEAMSAGLPVICSSIRGNEDLITEGVNGYLVNPKDEVGFAEKINNLISNPLLCKKMSLNNIKKIESYSKENIKNLMVGIYETINE